jgi:hypothetical protein
MTASQIEGKHRSIAIACRLPLQAATKKPAQWYKPLYAKGLPQSLKTVDDGSVMRRLAYALKKGTGCYVRGYEERLSVHNAFQRGRYAMPGVDFDAAVIPFIFEAGFRLGSYGEPGAACPQSMARCLPLTARNTELHSPMSTRNALQQAFKNTYARQARTASRNGVRYCRNYGMAHIPGPNMTRLALKNEAICPASKDGGTYNMRRLRLV